MGLDISVLQPIEATKEQIKLVNDNKDLPNGLKAISITEHPVLEKWIPLSFKQEFTFVDLKITFEKYGLNFEDYDWCMTGGNGHYFNRKDGIPETEIESSLKDNEFPGNDICIRWDDMITFKVEEDVLITKEIGYQRKGANSFFYRDSKWASEPIVDKETIVKHWDKYFSSQVTTLLDDSGNPFELEEPDSEMRNNFKRKIIDKFIEGETFLIYW